VFEVRAGKEVAASFQLSFLVNLIHEEINIGKPKTRTRAPRYRA
jgi:hypothetical protein